MLHILAGTNATAMLIFLWWRQFCFLKQHIDLAGKWRFSFRRYLEVSAFGFILMWSKTKVFSSFSQELKRVRQGLGDRDSASTMPRLRLVAKPLLSVIGGGSL